MVDGEIWGVVGAVAGGAIALGREIIRRHYDSEERKRAQGIEATLEAHERMQGAMSSALNRTRYDSIVLVKLTNGGEIPSPGKQLYASVFKEAYNEQMDPIRANWIGQPMDETYTSLMLQVVRDGAVGVIVESMPQSLLRNAYESQGIAYAEVVKVWRQLAELWVIGFHAREVFAPTPAEWEEIRRCQMACRDALKPIREKKKGPR